MLSPLRLYLRRHRLDAIFIPLADPHGSEYVAPCWQYLKQLTGFTGSAGTAIVTAHEACLWTDSRYWLQAEEEIKAAGFTLMREGHPDTPTPLDWLGGRAWAEIGEENSLSRDNVSTLLRKKEKAASPAEETAPAYACAVPDEMASCAMSEEWQEAAFPLRLVPVDTQGFFAEVWPSRPAAPCAVIGEQPLEWAGQEMAEKLARLAENIQEQGHREGVVFFGNLSDIAWLTNLRGGDVECNPVFSAWLAYDAAQASFTLFTHTESLAPTAQLALARAKVDTAPYDAVWNFLRTHAPVVCDPAEAPLALMRHCNLPPKHFENPVTMWRAVKNEAEIGGLREAMERDGVAWVRLLMWLERVFEKNEPISELTVCEKIEQLRSEQKGYLGPSFETIAAWGPHAAIVHYEPTPATDVPVQRHGLLLIDTGGQYDCGTTDTTRTLPCGPLTDEELRVSTLVFKGHLALQSQRFPTGTCGLQLDLAARSPLWNAGLDFGHGTGHGVGAHLCVHEGPHQIRKDRRPSTLIPLAPGMTITDEPGIYAAGRFGVRTENTLLVVSAEETEWGAFLRFEPLTLCPYPRRAIDAALLTPDELSLARAYHAEVLRRLAPRLTPAEQQWLAEQEIG